MPSAPHEGFDLIGWGYCLSKLKLYYIFESCPDESNEELRLRAIAVGQEGHLFCPIANIRATCSGEWIGLG